MLGDSLTIPTTYAGIEMFRRKPNKPDAKKKVTYATPYVDGNGCAGVALYGTNTYHTRILLILYDSSTRVVRVVVEVVTE